MSESTWKVAEVPLNFTDVAPVKFVPVIVTLTPTAPLVGKKPVIAVTVKLVALVAVPADVVTAIGPAVAPAGTGAVILVGELTV